MVDLHALYLSLLPDSGQFRYDFAESSGTNYYFAKEVESGIAIKFSQK